LVYMNMMMATASGGARGGPAGALAPPYGMAQQGKF
jgi:hypothetical protein